MTHEHNTKKLGWTILLNVIITVAEYIGGLLSGSLALLSDAGHNLSDVISMILGYYGEKISDKKADKKHSFGFKRVEIFTALINALALISIAFYILFEAFQRMNESQTISLGIMLGVGSIGLAGNFISILILNKEKDSTVNMKAAYLHLFYDTISSVFVIISAVIIYFTNFVIIDIVVSAIIAIMILFSSFEIIKKTLHILMQGVPEGLEFDELFHTISKIKGVKSVHNLHVWAVNSSNNFLSCHVCADKEAIKDSDKLIKRINEELQKKYSIDHTVIQIEKDDLCEAGAICSK